MNAPEYNNRIFAEGVHGVLRVDWRLRCVTPLAIRNGLTIGYDETKINKGRGLGVKFRWREPEESGYEVAILHFGYEIADGALHIYHYVPASSLRGALRSWTINHLVRPEFRKDMMPPEYDDEHDPTEQRQKTYLNRVKAALDDPHSGYRPVASLFGLAFETRKEARDLAHAGRLRVDTRRFAAAQPRPIAINGKLNDGAAGPANAHRQMTVRNPLDRMTHASKEGGLHHFLEFCAGESFAAQLTILNPRPADLGLLSFWVREMNEGLLRLGALASIGRGRVQITEQSYHLWQRADLTPLQRFESVPDTSTGEVLAGLWRAYRLEAARLSEFESSLREHV